MVDTPDVKNQRTKTAKKLALVRFGRMRNLGLFEHNEQEIPMAKPHVVVKTSRGLELGEVVGAEAGCYKDGRYRWDPDQVATYYKASEMDRVCEEGGKFIRFATPDDISEDQHLQKIAEDEVRTCQRIVNEMKLPMKIVSAEHILGGERIIFHFKADGRIDFRELVKTLSHEFQTRIEMRQIGARDEAKLVTDRASCGQECCCRRFLKQLKPVNMRMAKTQKATLDPSKTTGNCGRLKCCLRYEDTMYTELKRQLPKKNTCVRLPEGEEGRVVDGQILTQLVIVEKGSGERVGLRADEVEILDPKAGPRPTKPSGTDGPSAGDKPKESTEASGAEKSKSRRGGRSRRRSGRGGPPSAHRGQQQRDAGEDGHQGER